MPSKSARTSFLLRLVQLKVYNAMVEALRAFDLTPFQYLTLNLANRRGDWSTAEMARRFQVTPQSMNEVVAVLEAKGLIERHESPAHRRVLNVHLTAAGVQLLAKSDRAIDRVEASAFGNFSPSQLAEFRSALYLALDEQPAETPAQRVRGGRGSSAGAF